MRSAEARRKRSLASRSFSASVALARSLSETPQGAMHRLGKHADGGRVEEKGAEPQNKVGG